MNAFDSSQIPWRVPWLPVPPGQNAGTVAELHREMPTGHILFGRNVQAIGRHQDCYDVLFYIGDTTPQLAVVHLTYARESRPEWPNTTLFDTLEAWIEQCTAADAEDFGS